ncbi:hypothetical protein HanRHA438_Chr17g0817881 [Helianthus annuus]|uniref:WAT1-related protein n=1 Tax=Helianthus annuus TaxID=4232 RepID=A0A9K3DKK3_HELAN|nr:hypothetical protein HanXRQr2_Chr17g0808051 [Helianthus annuus]KAJ0429513.1 hypothetical protein HanHA300_Chr17g0658251 [Helianthus annuus]KAJ0434040.1 hypothetical protein HanIR_Chr17g0876971 [Helianthus annuus]KAJ0447900.1 hypothetical protein HanHA89_Chr17g0710641 [Helianthus annuus]KAJ0632798.1 hypothetical protein HanLR1_Chr17g0669251 [Helianthus annuus]
MYMISQAIVLKKYPAAVITLMFSYCLICTVLSGAVSLIVETDLSSFSLEPYSRLFSVLFSFNHGVCEKRGPLFVAMFHPVGIVIGVIFLGDGFYLGSLLGSIIVVIGFYTVMWGKAQEQKILDSSVSSKLDDETAPLLQDAP